MVTPLLFNPMKLSPHFTLEELYYSPTAIRRGIDNTPPDDVRENLRVLCTTILEPIRSLANQGIIITSGYRRLLLNSIIGGSLSSQHITGKAADIHGETLSVTDLYNLIKGSSIPFDQLIHEFDSWVHVSWDLKPRKQCLIATKENGKTIYTND